MRPSRRLGQEKDGRAAAYPDVITVASHTKKDNPAGLLSKPSSPATAPGRPYVLTRNAGGHQWLWRADLPLEITHLEPPGTTVALRQGT